MLGYEPLCLLLHIDTRSAHWGTLENWAHQEHPCSMQKYLQIPLSAMTGTIQPQEASAGIHVGRLGEKVKKEKETSLEKPQQPRSLLFNWCHNPGECVILSALWSCHRVLSTWTLKLQLVFITRSATTIWKLNLYKYFVILICGWSESRIRKTWLWILIFKFLGLDCRILLFLPPHLAFAELNEQCL